MKTALYSRTIRGRVRFFRYSEEDAKFYGATPVAKPKTAAKATK